MFCTRRQYSRSLYTNIHSEEVYTILKSGCRSLAVLPTVQQQSLAPLSTKSLVTFNFPVQNFTFYKKKFYIVGPTQFCHFGGSITYFTVEHLVIIQHKYHDSPSKHLVNPYIQFELCLKYCMPPFKITVFINTLFVNIIANSSVKTIRINNINIKTK